MNTDFFTSGNWPLPGQRVAEVLLAEDDFHDAILIRDSLRGSRPPIRLHHVEDGVECMAFLRRLGAHGDAPVPDLVVLDLNMPRMDGREVLAALAADEELRRLPVAVLTGSISDRDALLSYQLPCIAYLVKPLSYEDFQDVVRTIPDLLLSLGVWPFLDLPAREDTPALVRS